MGVWGDRGSLRAPEKPRRRVIRRRHGVRSACRRPRARTGPASRAAGARRSGLPRDALIELDLGCRRGVGVEATGPGIGQVPQRRAAGRCDARRRGGFAAVAEGEQRKRTAASPPANVSIAQNRWAAMGRLPLLTDRPRASGNSQGPDFRAAQDEQRSRSDGCAYRQHEFAATVAERVPGCRRTGAFGPGSVANPALP